MDRRVRAEVRSGMAAVCGGLALAMILLSRSASGTSKCARMPLASAAACSEGAFHKVTGRRDVVAAKALAQALSLAMPQAVSDDREPDPGARR
jgi:hypothetical protein